MNAVFTIIFCLSAAVLCVTAPQNFLTALLAGAQQSAKTAVTLFCIYAVWMGLAALAEKCGVTDKAAYLLKPVCRKVFKTAGEASGAIAMNLTCNLLGVGASAPYAVKAMRELEKEGNTYAQELLFLINAAGLQLIPSTVIALRAGAGSIAAADVFLPCFITSVTATLLSCSLYIFINKSRSLRIKFRKKGRIWH